jgi:hypothetical protein
MNLHQIFTNKSTSLNIGDFSRDCKSPCCTGFGHNCEVENGSDKCTIIGAYSRARVTADKSVAVGYKAHTSHKNSVVIGCNVESQSDDSVCIQNIEFKNNSLSLCNGKCVIIGDENIHQDCFACSRRVVRGIAWDKLNEVHTDDECYQKFIRLGLCFDCIFDCVLQFKTKERWVEKFGDPLIDVKNELEIMKKRIAELEK